MRGPRTVVLYADQLDNPVNSNWIVNALAPAAADSLNVALPVRRFDDAAEEGVGFTVPIPSGTTTINFSFISRGQTAPAAARTVGLKLYYRQIPDNAVLSTTWAGANDGSKVLTDIDIPANTTFQYDAQAIALSAFSPALVAGRSYQFELTRINPTGGTELVGDWDLLELDLDFS